MPLNDDGYHRPMLNLRTRFIVITLGIALAFGLVACGSEDDPLITTTAPGSETTEPVGS
jgi:hypothetical protein